MNALILAVALAALMPIVFAGLAKRQGGYDNHQPRAWLAGLEGAQARAQAAQENSHEAFPPFAAAVALALLLAPERESTITLLAYAFLGLRTAYGWAYITDRATLRSLLWMLALGCTLGIFWQAAA
ncbi:MAG: MAPEG family protein [Pseudomonadales bacterium]|nr:MAPEG family protein [Pseudomonadales bacterium]